MPRPDDLYTLPAGLPVPVDDGLCDHLPQMPVADILLSSTRGRHVSLRDASRRRRVVVYSYPKTGLPHESSPPGWDAIPGARGCTPQSCGFRDHHGELLALGAEVFGLSTQTTDYQHEMAERLGLPFEVLSDADRAFQRAMRLPTFDFDGETLLHRLCLVLRDGRVEHVFYPVFPPDANAGLVLGWLSSRR